MTESFEVGSVEETWAIARQFATRLKSGDVVCLEGDLGAGKTTFTQGLAAALGVDGRVTSPTFCLVQEHRASEREGLESSEGLESLVGRSDPLRRNPPNHPNLLVHMDLYRLNGEEDVLSIGWEDYLAEGAVIVVEWPERAGSLIPSDAYHITITHLEDEEARRIVIQR